jgi:hypothetical protein|tara:strand:- start:389 stop:1123 length:735 start_codon:yes stop_codon:yes gene_type:complete
METQIKIETILPFGPPILKTTIPSYVVDNLNKHCDATLADEQKLKDYDYSGQLAGNVKKEFKISGEFLNKEENFSNILRKLAERMVAVDVRGSEEQSNVSYLRNAPPSTTNIARKYITGCQVLTVWCVSQWGGDFNPLHIHSGDLSGVLYLKVPEGLEEEYKNEDHHPAVGDIEFITGVPQAFSRNSIKVSPKVGDLYVFPAWLHHTAYPFRTKEQERRSISFNIIYNIDLEKFKNEKMLVDKE